MLPAQRSGKSAIMAFTSQTGDIPSLRWQRNKGSTLSKDRDFTQTLCPARSEHSTWVRMSMLLWALKAQTKGHLLHELTLLQQLYILTTPESNLLVA